MHRLPALLIALVLASLAACSKGEPAAPAADIAMPAAAPAMAPPPAPKPMVSAAGQEEAAGAPASGQAQRRYLAVRHTVVLEAPAAQIEPVWRQLQAKVVELGGDVLEANLEHGTGGQPIASISFRLPPKHVPALFSLLAQSGEITSTHSATEDKTAEVIDVEAHLKNLADARDSLRKMLGDRTGKLSDVLAVQKELTETQSQLDSYAGQRKALAQETDMTRVDLSLQSPRTIGDASALTPLRDAWHSVGKLAAGSLAGLITLVAVVAPWLLLIVPVVLFLRCWLRRHSPK